VSDGVTDNLTFSELRRLLHGDDNDPVATAHRLVDAAHARSHHSGHPRAKIDDITAVAAWSPPCACRHAPIARSVPTLSPTC
jgi:serine/threonine protein phosphatase PrpC